MFTCVLLMALLSVSGRPMTWVSFTGGSPSPASFEALESDGFRTRVRVTVAGMEVRDENVRGTSFQSLRIPGGGLTTEIGKPEIPIVATLVAIPAKADCQVRIVEVDSVVLSGYRVHPAQKACLEGEENGDFRVDQSLYSVDSFYPRKLALLGEPCVMRDYRVAQLILYPVRYNPYRSQLIVYREVIVAIEYVGESKTNLKETPPRPSFAFAPLYRNLIVNYNFVSLGEDAPPGGYLVITHDAFYDDILPLVEWKQRKGWKTSVVKLSEIPGGPSTGSIQQYISDAYHNWVVPPEYVLLVGDVAGAGPLPAFNYLSNPTDHPYSLLEGDDYLPEVLVGRIPVAATNELQVVVSKILGYERNPYMGETQWYRRGLVVGGNYPAEVTTAVLTKKWVREKLLEAGYAEVDTVFYPPITTPDEIVASVNQGVSFVNYRGWSNSRGWHYPYFHVENVYQFANGWKLPIVTSISCGTGNFGAATDPCFGEAWLRAGTPTTPKGGVAFYGPTTLATQTRWNNSLDSGIYWGIFREDLFSFAQAAYRGKVEVYNNFPNNTAPGGDVEFYFHVYNALGDPELAMWTDTPESLLVQHLLTIPVGRNSFHVLVRSVDSQPLRGALVSLIKPGEVEITGTTGADGSIELPISTLTPDTMWVTVTKHDFIPYCSYTHVGLTGLFVGHKSHSIDDDNSGGSQGNGDGEVNPGETIELPIVLKNYGSSNTASGVTATLRCSDGFVTITDSVKGYGDISPGDTAISSPFIFSAAQSCTNLHQIGFQLGVTSSDSLWTSIVDIPVHATDLRYENHAILDGGNYLLDPGETADLEVTLCNSGGLGGSGVQAVLRSENIAVTVLDSLGDYGDVPAGSTATNSGDPFTVQADPSVAVGREIGFLLLLTGDGGYSDRTRFSLVIGEVTPSAPLGPDDYGYYAYDDTDTDYGEAPVYEWVELDPAHGGSGTLISLGTDSTTVLDLPFTFRFYGLDYDQFSVCANGWLSMGSTWMSDHYNWHIPAALGPPSLIAPYWDYLDPSLPGSGDVFYQYDPSNHRLIVEWSRVLNVWELPPNPPGPGEAQTFQAILLDPSHYPTRTGDGEILCQYHTISNNDSCHNYSTVGIENEEHSDGLEYTFANIYPPAAAPLVDGRTIKFTTDPPDSFTGVEEKSRCQMPDARCQIFPNPFTRITTIRFSVQGSRGAEEQRGDVSTYQPINLSIYNLTGRLVKTLVDGYQSVTSYQSPVAVSWDGRDDKGEELPSGLYFLRISMGDFRKTRKMVLVR